MVCSIGARGVSRARLRSHTERLTRTQPLLDLCNWRTTFLGKEQTMASFSKSFSDAFEKSAAVAQAGTFDLLKEKMKKDVEKTEKASQASRINQATLDIAEQSGQDTEAVAKVLEHVGNTDPEVSKLIFQDIQQKIKDRVDFDQSIQLKAFEGATLAATEIVKDLVSKGGTFSDGTPITLGTLGSIQTQSTNRALQSLGLGDIAQRIQASQQLTQTQDDFFTKQIPSSVDAKVEEKKRLDIAEIQKKEIESGKKLNTAVKRLSLLNRQFNEALPTFDKTAIEQRLSGKLSSIAAKWGVKENTKLLALLSNSRPIAINLIRAFGEVGNLSETEQQGALEVVDQAGLTEDERLDKVRQFAEFALAGASPEALDEMMKDPGVVDIVNTIGIKIPGFEMTAVKQEFKTGDVREKGGVKYKRQEDGKWHPVKS